MLHFIEAAGTPRQVAAVIRETLRSEIKISYALHQEKLQAHPAAHIEKKLIALQHSVEKYFPNLLAELRGLAAGAAVPLRDALVFSFEEELLSTEVSFEEERRAGREYHERCTAFAIRDGAHYWFGHNEDWDIELPLYVARVKPRGAPAFLAVGNAGQLPGTVAGLNEHGLAYSGNSIYGSTTDHGLPKTYCLRSFLGARNFADVASLVRQSPRTLGNNSIIISESEKKIATIEWSARKLEIFEPDTDFFVHTNHFLLPKMRAEQAKLPSRSSLARYRRANRLISRLSSPTLTDLQKILSDHAYNPIGICRHGKSTTLASLIFDVTGRALHIAYRSPCQNSYQTFAL